MPVLDINNLALNDINVDLITNSDKTGVFDKLMESVNDNINTQYTEGRITTSDYATVYLGSLQTVLQQSIQFALQEQVSEAQISAILKDNAIKDAQLEETYNLQQAQLEKQWGYAVTRDTDSSIILGASTGTGKIDRDTELTVQQVASETLNNQADGVLENQILKIKEDILVAKEQVEIAKTQTATEQANSIANIDKVLGYSYTLDGEGNIVVGSTTGEGKLDYEKQLVRQQTRLAYTETVLKDKQTAKLGLDNTMKLSEAAKDGDANFVYSPNYTDPGV